MRIDPTDIGQALVSMMNEMNSTGSAADLVEYSELDGRVATPVDKSRLMAAKRSYATRRIDLSDGKTLLKGDIQPAVGDLVLARIENLGHHRRLESPAGRRARLYLGDEILLLYGNRYATDQFEAIVPESLENCHMVAGGGIAAQAILSHSGARQPTEIQPLGLVGNNDGRPLNLKTYAQEISHNVNQNHNTKGSRVIVVVGTSMNAGKTTLAAKLIKGLTRSGFSVSAGKVTGTGSGGDRWSVLDAGASQVVDFTDFGHPSTYQLPKQALAKLFADISDSLCATRPDYIVLEIADGLFFSETADLVQSSEFRERVDEVMLAASDAMGAVAGVKHLADMKIDVYAVGGIVSASPLAAREFSDAIDVPLVTSRELANADWAYPVARELFRNTA